MPSIHSMMLFAASAVLVFAAGWRLCSPQNAAGGTAALLLFLFHPAILAGMQSSSPWDSLFVMLFVTAWLWMEHWSVFMRSWVLAGIFSVGLWLGSPFVLWGLMAMVPWVLFNRRPLAAVGSLLTVLLGGLTLFAVSWVTVWQFAPAIGRPLFSQWIRWSGFSLPPAVSLPWFLLAVSVVAERLQGMVRERRSDAAFFAVVLLVITVFLASPNAGLALIALSSPLIAQALVKREFLFHRGVRWTAFAALVATLVLGYVLKTEVWVQTGLAMGLVIIGSRWLARNSKLPWGLAAEAACVGAYLAEFLRTLLPLIPSLCYRMIASIP